MPDRWSPLALAMGGLALASGPAEGVAPAELHCEGAAADLIPVDEVSSALSRRAVDIMRAAARSDRVSLARLVSPEAGFTLWRGDAGLGREFLGVEGAIIFAGQTQAAQFAFAIPFAGMVSTDPCMAQQVELWFSSGEGDRGQIVRFRFERGLLVEAEGREVRVIRGRIDADATAHSGSPAIPFGEVDR